MYLISLANETFDNMAKREFDIAFFIKKTALIFIADHFFMKIIRS